jgi:hypothetical protein
VRPDDLRRLTLSHRFVCQACGLRGADVRPDFTGGRKQVGVMGYW